MQEYKQKIDVLHNRIEALKAKLLALKGKASPKDIESLIAELDEFNKTIYIDVKKTYILDGATQFSQVYGQDVNYKIF